MLCLNPVMAWGRGEANLTRNPGFEQGTSSWDAKAWRMDPGAVEFRQSLKYRHSGKASFEISNLQDNDSALLQDIAVHGGSLYEISGWIKTRDVNGTQGLKRENIGACLCLRDTWIRSNDLKGSQDWARVSFIVKTRPDQTTPPIACRLGYWGNTVKGMAWFDDITVEELKETPGDSHADELDNPIVNAGFEKHAGNFYEFWVPNAWMMKPDAVEFSFDSETKHRGRSSAKITHPVFNDSGWTQEIGVGPNQVYKVSGWIKTKDVSGNKDNRIDVGANLCINGTWIRSPDLKGTQPWTHTEFIVRTGPRQTTLPIACRLGYWSSVVKGTAWFDDVRVALFSEPAKEKDAPLYDPQGPPNKPARGRLLLAVVLGLVAIATMVSIILAVKS